MLFSHARDDGSLAFHYPDAAAHEVRVTGSFCGWEVPGQALERVEGGWRGEVGPVPRGEIEYKFVVDGRWLADPLNLLVGRDGNSLLHTGRGRGAAYHLRFHAPALGESRAYALYLPPGYATDGRRFPVLYLLHGALDWERTWIERGRLAEVMDRLRAEELIGDMVVVMPNDNGALFADDGRIVDYLARDVVGHVDFEYRTLAQPQHRAIDGLSTGGYTSLMLGAWRPTTFRSIGCMSGCFDQRSFEAIASAAPAMRAAEQRYLLSCGLGEPHLDTNRAAAHALREVGVPVSWQELPGEHDWHLWRESLVRHVRFHWQHVAPGA